MMRWLQWSTNDLKNGLGGVEVHARSLVRELSKKGIEAALSSDPKDLEDPRWDVIHTHGSSPAPAGTRVGNPKAIRIHTLHGTTLGRMAACGEWLWPGGYAAEIREIRGIANSDIVLSVHPKLSLLKLARKMGRTTRVCWNGWDSAPDSETDTAFEKVRARFEGDRPFWVFLGRGEDRMKGADRLQGALRLLPDIRLLAAPGAGFEGNPSVKPTGLLSSAEARAILRLAEGLVLPSRYEGNSLVVLEALAMGVPVVATKVGGVPVLPSGVEGVVTCDSATPQAIADAIRGAARYSNETAAREARARTNRALIPSWRNVVEIALDAVSDQMRKSPK